MLSPIALSTTPAYAVGTQQREFNRFILSIYLNNQSCCGLHKNGLHRFMYLNTYFPVDMLNIFKAALCSIIIP